MSTRTEGFAPIPTWMIRDKSIPRSALLVYASLSSRSGLGAIFPSQAAIAEEAGVSERTVRTMLRHLEEVGVVERARRKTKGMKRVTDAYVLHPNGRIDLAATSAGRSDLAADLPATGDASTGNSAHSPLYEAEIEEADNEAAPRKRGTRIPDPFVVTSEMWAWAADRCPLVDGRRSTEMFVNHWRARTGQIATKKDWPATWRNWLLKDQADAERRSPRAGTFAQQKQNNMLDLVGRIQEEERHAQVGSREAAGVLGISRGA